jgi:BASS family bile acid:Na+ symporter
MDLSWLALLARAAIFAVMLSLGLLLGREHLAAALQRRMLLAAVVFAVIVPVPVLAVLFVKGLGLSGAVAAGIVLMSISPGAPVALRRALSAGGRASFAPALHLAIVIVAVVSVPLSMVFLGAIFRASFKITPLQVAGQVFVAQLLPLAIGVVIRALWPALAAKVEPPLARLSNFLLFAFLVACLYVLWPLLKENGWMPVIAGVVLTAASLGLGSAFAAGEAAARPPAAIAAAMRNPGLALYIAAVNQAPLTVIAAVFAYALGAAVVITAYMLRRRRKPA